MNSQTATITTDTRVRPNATWITPDLACGGDLAYDPMIADAQADRLVADGITHVFDARIEADDAEVWGARGVQYQRFGVNDAYGYHLPQAFFDRAVEMARDAQASEGKILAHCHMGVNRGPSAAVAILMDRGMAPIAALKLIIKRRPIAGVYYFMDAYDADIERKGLKRDWQARAAVLRQFRAIVDTEHLDHVQRAISAGHERDARARRAWLDSIK